MFNSLTIFCCSLTKYGQITLYQSEKPRTVTFLSMLCIESAAIQQNADKYRNIKYNFRSCIGGLKTSFLFNAGPFKSYLYLSCLLGHTLKGERVLCLGSQTLANTKRIRYLPPELEKWWRFISAEAGAHTPTLLQTAVHNVLLCTGSSESACTSSTYIHS